MEDIVTTYQKGFLAAAELSVVLGEFKLGGK